MSAVAVAVAEQQEQQQAERLSAELLQERLDFCQRIYDCRACELHQQRVRPAIDDAIVSACK